MTSRCSPKRVIRRSKTGCQQCRQRKRKCDEQHPRCLACVERSLSCTWRRQEPQRTQPNRRQPRYNKDFEVPQEMRPLVTIFAVPSTPMQERLLSYFYVTSPLWLTSTADTGPPASSGLIMPLALEHPLVLNCVLTLAAGDMKKYQPASSELASLSYAFYGQAVSGIRSAINGEGPPESRETLTATGGDTTLLAVMLLCLNEAQNVAEPDRIIPHITAAATLCHTRYSSRAADTPLRGLVLELFCYMFTMAAFSHGHMFPLSLALQIFNSPLFADVSCQGVLLGQQTRTIFSMILRASILLQDNDGLDEAAVSELRIFESHLEQLPAPRGSPSDEETASELYRVACLIHVMRVLHPDLTSNSTIVQSLLSSFINTLSLLPPASPANNILCWPLVVAGISSANTMHQRIIVGRLRNNYETWRSDVLIKAAEFLSRKWKDDKTLEAESLYFHGRRNHGTSLEAFKIPVVLL